MAPLTKGNLVDLESAIYIPEIIEESADRRVQSAKNRSPQRGLVLKNTTPFLEIDFWQLSIPTISRFFNHFRYTARNLRIGFWAGLKAALNQLKKTGQYWCNTAPFFFIDLTRFAPPQKPILKFRAVYCEQFETLIFHRVQVKYSSPQGELCFFDPSKSLCIPPYFWNLYLSSNGSQLKKSTPKDKKCLDS